MSYTSLRDTENLLRQSLLTTSQTAHQIDQQGSVLQGASDDVQDTQHILRRSRQIVVGMLCRALVNRLFLYFVILALIAGNIIALYFKFRT